MTKKQTKQFATYLLLFLIALTTLTLVSLVCRRRKEAAFLFGWGDDDDDKKDDDPPAGGPPAAPPPNGLTTDPSTTTTDLVVHYDFSTGTYDEQVTNNPTYTLVSKAGTENYPHSITTRDDGTQWLSVSNMSFLTAPIGPLVPTTQNFTFMLHYDFTSTSPMSFGSDLMNLPSNYEGVQLNYYQVTSGGGSLRWKIHPDPTTQGYATYDNTSKGETRTTVVQSFNSNLPFEGSLPDINNWRGEHVMVGVCNFNQTTGTDLASEPGTITFYLDNRPIKSMAITNKGLNRHINPVDYAAHVLELYSTSDGGPVYFKSFKIYEGVVDMRMLNELSTS